MSDKMHPLLTRQIKSLGLVREELPRDQNLWDAFLDKISKAYYESDQERYLLERSLHISSKEMQERWESVQILQEQWKSLAECAPDIILTVDRECKILYSNRPEFSVGSSVLGISHVQGRSMFKTLIEGSFDRGETNALDFQGADKGEEQTPWYSIRLGPIKEDGKVARAVLLISDITANKLLQEEVEHERAAAIQSSKMATLGEMASGIAHEINNPLCIINGVAMQLKKMATKDKLTVEVVTDLSKRISQTVDRIHKIVQGLRAFARDGTQDPFVAVRVAGMVDETLELCREKLRNNNIELRLMPIPVDLQIDCQPVQISQILLNLIHNAVDAIEGLPEKWVEVEVLDLEDKVALQITDSGNGIPTAIREKLMRPFFTTKPLGKGTGLGLSISRGIVESHGGTLSIDTDCPNTRFRALLPKRQGVLATNKLAG